MAKIPIIPRHMAYDWMIYIRELSEWRPTWEQNIYLFWRISLVDNEPFPQSIDDIAECDK